MLFTTVSCAAFLVLADRCAVLYAEKKAEQRLQEDLHLEAAPQVDIHGFPFLTQVAAKHLQRVDVTVPHVDAGRVTLAKVQAGARDIRIDGDLPASVRGAVVGRLDGDVLLKFADMNRELGASQVRFSPSATTRYAPRAASTSPGSSCGCAPRPTSGASAPAACPPTSTA
ncbi:DUF2993 domain-containing protein [Streptomyces stramineus]